MSDQEKPTAIICQRCGNVDDQVPIEQICPDTGESVMESRRCPCPHDALQAGFLQHMADISHRAATRRARERMIHEKRRAGNTGRTA